MFARKKNVFRHLCLTGSRHFQQAHLQTLTLTACLQCGEARERHTPTLFSLHKNDVISIYRSF